MNLARAEASSTFLRILAVPSKQAFSNIWKRWLIALPYSLDLIFKFLRLFHLLLFSHRPRCLMGIRYLSMSILVGRYNTTVCGVESSRTLLGLWSPQGSSPPHFQAPFRLCDRTMFFLNIFQDITIAILSCLQFLHFFCACFVHFETVWEASPLFRHTFCNYCQYPPCPQPSRCFLFLVPVLAPPSSHLPFLFDPLLFNHSQDLFAPTSSVAMTNLL